MGTGGDNLTLEEIGRRAGVSRSTVSRVLNERPDVRPEVRKKVEAVIAETGYLPNQAARALVSNRSGLIGLVIITDAEELFGDPYYSALVYGIQQGCIEHDLVFSIFPVEGSGRNTVTRQIAQGFVDGVVVTAGPRSEEVIAELRKYRTRLVVIGHPADTAGLLRIDVDNHRGSMDAVEHLLGLGYGRVGLIAPSEEFSFGVERRQGYEAALSAAGATVDSAIMQLAQPTVEGGRVAAEALLAHRPDAIYVATDTMALGVLEVLAERGLRVPDDIAIVGFDGLPGSPKTTPSLTTVVQPVGEVGRAAVELLVGDEEPPHLTVFPTHLKLGDSCGRTCQRDEHPRRTS